MPIIVADNHPECSVDCESGRGYAVFYEFYGPCKAKCQANEAVKEISEFYHRTDTETPRTSGRISGIQGFAMASLAFALRPLISISERLDDIERLRVLGVDEGEKLFALNWAEADVFQFIHALANARRLE